ncbi:unnamed protein product [Lymnaea stagnalis]|uniref:Protein NATD1 n=1 Tax=Lymnaea stagnalis TaxID=6523 RepID=A0AAV2HAN7_LYMST
MQRLSLHFINSSKNSWGSSYGYNNDKDIFDLVIKIKNVLNLKFSSYFPLHNHCVYKTNFSYLRNPFLPLLGTLALHRQPLLLLLDLPEKTAWFWNSYTVSRLRIGIDLDNEILKFEETYIYNCNNSCKSEMRRHQSQSTHFCDTVKSASSEPQTEGLNMSAGTSTNYVVGHDKKETYFYIKLRETTDSQAGSMAILQYNWVRPGLADLHHTEVPSEFQGRGIAKHLVLAALDSLCEENIIIRPTCTYVQKVLKDNPVALHINHIEKGFTFQN